MIKNPGKTFDLRTIEASLAKGEVSQKDYEKHLKSLPDDENNYDIIEIDAELDEDDEEDFDDEDEEDLE